MSDITPTYLDKTFEHVCIQVKHPGYLLRRRCIIPPQDPGKNQTGLYVQFPDFICLESLDTQVCCNR